MKSVIADFSLLEVFCEKVDDEKITETQRRI